MHISRKENTYWKKHTYLKRQHKEFSVGDHVYLWVKLKKSSLKLWIFSKIAPHVTADFTTHGGSHIYGFPYPSADSLDPMDHFCTFDVSNIIPKNMQKIAIDDF